MKVLLLADVKNVGKKDDVVNVSDGYARNMLFPKKLAVQATPKNIKDIEQKKKSEARIAAEQLKEGAGEVLGRVDVDSTLITPDSGVAPKAPGMKYRHYAPKGELVIVEGERDKVVSEINRAAGYNRAHGLRTGVICTDETRDLYDADCVKSAGPRGDEDSVARELFRILREFDDDGAERIYSESFSGGELGQAIMNRLMKAAGHRVVRTDEGETLHFK